MNLPRPLSLITATLALAAAAQAQFSVSGPGGPLNSMGATAGGLGGGGNSSNVLPTAWSEYPLSMPVPAGQSRITSVDITGLNHTWSGDLQVVLQAPSGTGYNLIVRIGVIAPAACCGHSADFNGNYSIYAAGDPSINSAWPAANPGGAVAYAGGNYPQEFGLQWGAGWMNGAANVFNTDLAAIPVEAGIWRLFIYDGAAADTGSLGGWTLNGGVGGLGTNYCPAVANSTGSGATISGTGTLSIGANNFGLTASSLPVGAFGYFLASMTQGLTMNPGGSQGNLCLGGSIGRFVGPGQIQIANANGEISLSVNLLQHPTPGGLMPVNSGETWNYTSWFRDMNPGVTSNFSNGVTVTFTN